MVRQQALLAARAGSSLLPASTTARVVGSSLLLPLSTAATTIRTFARDSHQPPADVMLALRRVSSLRQRCTDIARVLEEAGVGRSVEEIDTSALPEGVVDAAAVFGGGLAFEAPATLDAPHEELRLLYLRK